MPTAPSPRPSWPRPGRTGRRLERLEPGRRRSSPAPRVALADAVQRAEALVNAAQDDADRTRAEAVRLLDAASAEAVALQAELLAEIEEEEAARFEVIDARSAAVAAREAALEGEPDQTAQPAAIALAPRPDGAGEGDGDRPKRRWGRGLRIAILVMAVLAASQLVRAFVITAFIAPSTSMVPAIAEHDRLLPHTLEMSYGSGQADDQRAQATAWPLVTGEGSKRAPLPV